MLFRSIRNGAWEFDYLLSWARERTDEIYELLRSKRCTLPDSPDQTKLEDINAEVIRLVEETNNA